MLSFEEFRASYEKTGMIPLSIGKRSKPLTDEALNLSYKKYCAKIEKQEKRLAEKMQGGNDEEKKFVKAVRDRDEDCVLTDRLDLDAFRLVKNDPIFKQGVLDVAHIISRARAPHVKYDPDNAVLLNRLFHSRIDTYRNPISGQPMSEEQREKWLQILVGDERWKRLQDKYRKNNS